MAEHAVTYFTILVLVFNVSLVAGLVTIVALAPRRALRRPAHRAATAPLHEHPSPASGAPRAA